MSPEARALVAASISIACSEARRLQRLGVTLEIEDAVQTALLALVEQCENNEASAGHARNVIRQALSRAYGEAANAVKRGGPGRPGRCRPRARAIRVELTEETGGAAPSPEDDIIARIDTERRLEKVAGVIGLVAAPVLTGATRQAKQQSRKRWAQRIRMAVREAA